MPIEMLSGFTANISMETQIQQNRRYTTIPVSYTHLDVYKRQDVMCDELEARDPDHFAVKQYRKYKLAAGKTAKSILISCSARLAVFDMGKWCE